MRRAIPALAVAAALAGVACGAASSGQTARPQLRLMDDAPFTLRGTGFKVSEHVRLVARTPALATRQVTAGSAGGFMVRFAGAQAGYACTGLTVSAVGDKGSRASYKRPPEACGALP